MYHLYSLEKKTLAESHRIPFSIFDLCSVMAYPIKLSYINVRALEYYITWYIGQFQSR